MKRIKRQNYRVNFKTQSHGAGTPISTHSIRIIASSKAAAKRTIHNHWKYPFAIHVIEV